MVRMIMFVLLYILIHVGISVAKIPRQEIVTVTQHTQSPRARRHADPNINPDGFLTGNDFPDHMMFTLHLNDMDVTLQLQKYTTPKTVKLHDQDGPIYVQPYDKHRQYTVYQDIEFTSSMIVDCWQSTTNCILNGRFQVNGVEWKLNHRGLTDDWGTYNATEVIQDVNKNSIRGLKPKEDIVKESKGTLDFAYKMLNALISRESTKEEESTSGLPSKGTSHVRRKKDIHVMKKRGIPSTCHIIEIGVYADHTVWAYFLAKAGGNESVAESMVQKHYEFLFAQVDCRFRDLDQYGICIRIYLGMVTIEKNDDSSQWSLPVSGSGMVNALLAITERCDTRAKAGQDFIICTTRKDIEWVGTVTRPDSIRCVTYINVLCEMGDYTYMISEDLHDDQDLLIAHTLMISMGGDQDSLSGCDDADAFISSTYNDPPANPPATDENPWKFSTCSVTAIDIYLNTKDVSCLEDGSVSESDVIDFNQNRLLPGKQLYDLDEQCSYAFGLNTTACQSPNQTSIFEFDEICVLGVYCFVNSTCTSRTRVYNGSPCGCKKYCFKNRCLAEFNTTLGTDCNSVCNNVTNTCVCDEGYYQQGSGQDAVCLPKIELGNNCSVNGSCIDSNAECEAGVCTCNSGYINICNRGVCEPLVDVGANCSQTGICRDENAECVNGVCTCNGGYFVDCGGIMCLPYQSIKKPCYCSDQCSRVNALCIEGKCRCNSTEFVNQHGDCEQRVDIGENCTTDEACDDQFAECSQSGTCTCQENYVNCGDNICRLEQCIGGSCNCSLQCSAKNGDCENGVCECNDTDFVNAFGICERRVDIGENCTTDDACNDKFAQCSQSGTCTCKENFVNCGDNMCRLEQCIGGSCNCLIQCSAKNGYCDSGVCKCNETDFVNAVGVCETRVDIGENCTTDDACDDEFAECSQSGICICKHNYVDSGDTMCILEQCIGGSCNLTIQCSAKNGFCENGVCKCNYTEFVNTVGDCTLRVAVGENCTTDDACDDEFAECSLNDICTCKENYVDCDETMCLLEQCIGGPCECSQQCAAKNGFCDNDVCKCIDTDFLNEFGVCENRPVTDESCTDNNSGGLCVNGTCDENTCKGGIPLYDECGSDASCALNPKAVCKSYSFINIPPPDGGSASRLICVCNESMGWVAFGGKCVCVPGTLCDGNV